MTSLDGFGTGDLRALFFRKEAPKADNVLVVASHEVSIANRDYGINTRADAWLHFKKIAPLWPLLQSQSPKKLATRHTLN